MATSLQTQAQEGEGTCRTKMPTQVIPGFSQLLFPLDSVTVPQRPLSDPPDSPADLRAAGEGLVHKLEP